MIDTNILYWANLFSIPSPIQSQLSSHSLLLGPIHPFSVSLTHCMVCVFYASLYLFLISPHSRYLQSSFSNGLSISFLSSYAVLSLFLSYLQSLIYLRAKLLLFNLLHPFYLKCHWIGGHLACFILWRSEFQVTLLLYRKFCYARAKNSPKISVSASASSTNTCITWAVVVAQW